MDDIWSEIRSAAVLVAELTGRNPNVFYELGLAHALSKPVILMSTTMEDVPFDLRSIRVLIYDKEDPEWGAKLRQALVRALREVLSAPNAAIPSTFKIAVPSNAPRESELLIRLERLENNLDRALALNSPSQSIAASVGDLLNGDRVLHRQFGEGTVVKFEGAGSSTRVQVNFDGVGAKWLLPKYAGLQLISRATS